MDHYQWNYYSLHQCPERIYHPIVGQTSDKLASFIILAKNCPQASFIRLGTSQFHVRVCVFSSDAENESRQKTDKWHSSNLYASHRICFPHDLYSTKGSRCMLELLCTQKTSSLETQRKPVQISRIILLKMKANLKVSGKKWPEPFFNRASLSRHVFLGNGKHLICWRKMSVVWKTTLEKKKMPKWKKVWQTLHIALIKIAANSIEMYGVAIYEMAEIEHRWEAFLKLVFIRFLSFFACVVGHFYSARVWHFSISDLFHR